MTPDPTASRTIAGLLSEIADCCGDTRYAVCVVCDERMAALVPLAAALIIRERALVAALRLKLCDKCCYPPEMCDSCKRIDALLAGQPRAQDEVARLREALRSAAVAMEHVAKNLVRQPVSIAMEAGDLDTSALKARATLDGKAPTLSGEEEARRQSRPDDVT